MDIFSVFALLGGLAMFLYGMNVMGSGLEKVSGGRFERILEKLTSNPVKAVLLGAGVTAVIQSSSATTVMVVGFVNSGIMKLSQAVGIIMGANLGTTATSWLLSLTSLQGDSFLVQICKPANFSPLFAFIGIILIMFSKKERRKDVGSILIGFSVLMFGMEMMSDAVKPLADVPAFTNILTMFQNPIFGVLAGALLTAVIQSSSASVGILQALSATGRITFGAAIPIIMGQNIGTCVTALISSLGASKNAKRAAFIHLYFNIIGTVLFLVLFYVAHYLVRFSFIDGSIDAVGIAVVHTVFNVISTAVLLPFNRQLEKLAYLTVKEGAKEDANFGPLDERFLQTPSFAIEQCKNLAVQMAHLSRENISMAIELVWNFDEKKVQKVRHQEEMIDMYEDRLGNYLVKLSGRQLSIKDSQAVSMLLHTIGDLERIADHSVNLAQTANEIHEKQISFSEKAGQELKTISGAVSDILELSIQSFEEENLALADQVEPLEEVIDDLSVELKKRHVRRLQEGKCTIELGFIFSDLLNNFERVSDHCSNVAVSVLQEGEEDLGAHEYLNEVKKTDNHFKAQYKQYAKKYLLP